MEIDVRAEVSWRVLQVGVACRVFVEGVEDTGSVTTEHPGSPTLGTDDQEISFRRYTGAELALPDPRPEALHELMGEFNRFMMVYKFGLAEIGTKISILAEELSHRAAGNPIEHVSPRLKSSASLTAKAQRIGCPLTFDDLRANIRDIAGIRIVCSFASDVYTVAGMLTRQPDVTLLQTKDYIAEPKPNGYRSLHLIVEIPVFMSDRVISVPVEVQLRTVAMDFWASLEHKIYYKHGQDIPAHLRAELMATAEDAARLDRRMERLHRQIHGPRH